MCPVSTGRLYFRKWGCLMTFTPEEDLAKHLRFIVEYEDGSRDAFAVSGATLQQDALEIGPPYRRREIGI